MPLSKETNLLDWYVDIQTLLPKLLSCAYIEDVCLNNPVFHKKTAVEKVFE